jgi:hypothetical protein
MHIGLEWGDVDRGCLTEQNAVIPVFILANPFFEPHLQGTRMFQTMMVLRCYEALNQDVPMYDYLDDLEAFFWVFTYIIMAYRPNGDRMLPNHLQERTLVNHLQTLVLETRDRS